MYKGRVGIAALKLVDPETQKVLSRGRWLYAQELSRLLVERGYKVTWWQLGKGWKTEIMPGVSLTGDLPDGTQLFMWPRAGNSFLEKAAGVQWAIYFDQLLAYPQVHEYSLVIAHGINWDNSLFESRLLKETQREEWKRRIWITLHSPIKVITADSGLIQWATATWPGLQHKFEYIPDFVPESPAPGPLVQPDAPTDEAKSIRVLFPGHLSPGSGISETIRAMEPLLAMNPDLQFFITGNGAKPVTEYITTWTQQHPRAHFGPQPLTDELLDHMDIVLFPARINQGLSTACLQAMAAGKIVIVGHSGGLTDIVIHDHNGIIIRPATDTLIEAIVELAAEPGKRKQLGANARKTARSFSLDIWRDRWNSLLDRTFGRVRTDATIRSRTNSNDDCS